jgi:hypothetical protein
MSIETSLWNTEVGEAAYQDDGERYRAAVFDQYKLCVESAEHVSTRRGLTNSFFLSLNVLLITLLGPRTFDGPPALRLCVLSGALLQCLAWWLLLRSYRRLNSAKFRVIAALEERLPAFAFSRAEWAELTTTGHLRLTSVERWIPVLFAVTHLLTALIGILIPSRS